MLERDSDGAGREVLARLPGWSGGEEHGARDVGVDGVSAVAGFMDGDRGSGRDAAERVRDGIGHAGDVIKDEKPFAEGEVHDRTLARGQRMHRRGHGVDQGTKKARGGGFSAIAGTLENEDGVGARRLERRKQPIRNERQAGGRRVDEGREGRGRIGDSGGIRCSGAGKRELAAGAAEQDAWAGGDVPTERGDGNAFAFLVAEVDEDGGSGTKASSGA